LGALRRLPPLQSGHRRRQISAPQHGRLHCPPGQLPHLQQAGPQQGVSSGAGSGGGHTQDGDNNAVWLFEFARMPFGLKNVGMMFQRMIDSIFQGLPFIFIYLDDVLIASMKVEEHCRHLRHVLQLLADIGLLLNVQKCVLGASSMEFLGHRLTAGGVQPLPNRIAALNSFLRPRTVKDLQAFFRII
jgi:Reverse transcriptase (RNA-dependent DNA polymerase)